MNNQLVKQLFLMSILSVCLSTPFTLNAAGLPPYAEGQPLPSLAPMLERSYAGRCEYLYINQYSG